MAKTLGSLPSKSKVKFGTIYGKAIVWEVRGHDHTGYPAGSTTLYAEKIIKIMAFDAKEPSNTDSNRKSYGNNRWLHSNLRQWANSDKAANAWYSAQHNYDAPPAKDAVTYNPYQDKPGFLNPFTAEERAALMETSHVVARASVDGGGTETVKDKIFLPNYGELGLSGGAGGTPLDGFTDNTSRVCQVTDEAKSNSDYTSVSSPWYYWTGDACDSDSYYVRSVDYGGTASDGSAYYGGYGFRPACNLPSSLLVSDSPDGDNCYTIQYNTPPTISCQNGNNTDLGTKAADFNVTYTVDDTDAGDKLTATESIDGTQKKSFSPTRQQSNTFAVTGTTFQQLINGKHTMQIKVNDGHVDVFHTLTFTKEVKKATITLTKPLEADAQIKAAVLTITGDIPEDAKLTVQVTNNGKDGSPTWEDATTAVKAGNNIAFSNAAKTADKWAFNFKIEVERGDSNTPGYIQSIQGGFQ